MYGNNDPGPNALPGLRSGGTPARRGWFAYYNIRISMEDLYILYGSLAAFKAAWNEKSAIANQGNPIPLDIIGLTDLPPLSLRVLTNGGKVGIQGDTWVASKFFPLRRLGAAEGQPDTFAWEKSAKVFVCKRGWSVDHVRQLITAAAAGRVRVAMAWFTPAELASPSPAGRRA